MTIAYIRPIFLKSTFGAAYEYQAIKFNDSDLLPRLVYFAMMILVHHFVLFILIVFDNSKVDVGIVRVKNGFFQNNISVVLTFIFSFFNL